MDEKITFGEDQCPDGSIRPVFDPAAGTLDYSFTPASAGGGAAATGTLTRP